MSAARFTQRVEAPGARDLSVFINCPFDEAYAPLRDALVFSTVCSGFLPRSAMDLGDIAVPRMERILAALSACRYSIHDLSRCTGEGDMNLARFNMPLELGIAMAHKHSAIGGDHDWFALVPDGHAYVKFASDLAGFDPMRHDNLAETVVRVTTSWLWTRDGAMCVHRPPEIVAALPRFTAARQQLEVDFGDSPPWREIYEAARDCLPVQS